MLLLAVSLACSAALAQGKAPATRQASGAPGGEIRIAHIRSTTGPLEAYGKQTTTGFMMGLEYATEGTMMVAGKRLVVIEKDDQGKPDLGKSLLAAAYADDRADIAVGPTSSGVALAMLPVADEFKKILLVEPAVADSITGDKWNKYIFRTGRNSSQDAIANAVALDKPGVVIATLGQDSAFGRDFVTAFKDAAKSARIVHEEYLPPATTDFTAAAQRMVDKLKAYPAERKVIFINWAGAGNPFKIADLDLKRHGIEIATGGNILPAMVQFGNFPGMQGATYYYYAFSRNPSNMWLVTNHYSRYKAPPDFFTAGGFSSAMALVTALRKTQGDASTPKLLAAMEGMSFETPKGTMTFRKEDHQAMQTMYHFRVAPGARPGAIPDLYLVKEIKAADMSVPVRNKTQVAAEPAVAPAR
jgi:branched-chain amino acid transport system substrate-binding protein